MSPALAPVTMCNTHPSRWDQLFYNLDVSGQAGPDYKIGPTSKEIEKYKYYVTQGVPMGVVMKADAASKIFLRLLFIL